VETHEEVIKYLMAGADVVMTASAVLRHGPGHIQTLRSGLESFLDGRSFPSVQAVCGLLSAKRFPNQDAILRAQYIETLLSYS